MPARLPYFKSYDVRGTVPDQLNAESAYQVARAAAQWSGAEEILLGRDARLSSPSLAEAVVRGLTDSGVTVLDLGLVSTPLLNFGVARYRRHGLMITASHNPKHYNGIKVIDPNVEQVYYGRGLEAMEALIVQDKLERPGGGGRVSLRPILPAYEDHLAERFGGEDFSSLRVAVDCSNGVGGLALGVLERLGVRHRLLYHIPDGNFPNHACDTLRPENLKDLRRAVREEGADLGVMFDGDSDRVVFVDEGGEIAPLDLVFVLLARQAVQGGGGRVFYDLRFSRVVKEEVEKLGGAAEKLRVGNPFHKEALHRHPDALLAAELSGHIMYKEHFGIDDPLYAFLKLLTCLARAGGKLSALLQPFRRTVQSGELRITAEDPRGLAAKLEARYADARISMLDGITVEYPDWWFNLRPSNTEPVAKLVMEADSPSVFEAQKRALLDCLAGIGGTLEPPGGGH